MTLINLNCYADFLRRHSDTLKLYKANKCPCGSIPDANRVDFNCIRCKGLGFVYDAFVNIQGAILSLKKENTLMIAGVAKAGDCVLLPSTVPGDNVITDYDLIEFPKPEIYEGDLITKGADTKDRLMYKPQRAISCFSWDINKNKVVYVEGTDFNLLSTKEIQWISANKPATGVIYTLKYWAYFEWVCYISPMIRFESGSDLGNKVLLRKRHLVYGGTLD